MGDTRPHVGAGGTAVVYLTQAHTATERAILANWIAGERTGGETLPLPPADGGDESAMVRFADRLAAGDDPVLCPLRVAWLPKERDGKRQARLRDLLLGNPRRPSAWRQAVLRRLASGRYRVIVAEPASVSELRRRYEPASGSDPSGFARFVVRQAVLAIERAEYRVVGTQYKVPRLVREEILESPRFEAGVARLAGELDKPVDEIREEAIADLDEMVAGYSHLFLDSMASLGRLMSRPGYGDHIDYVPSQIEMVRETFAHHPAIVLPSHKSQLDGVVVARALHDNGLPPTHIFAGINMSFGPLKGVLQRAGRIFIRRSMKDDPVYRWVLREYVGYLMEKRFNLEFYIEGTRSRTGKLMPPKLGLLHYVIDAHRDGRSEDVAMVPMSIIYDELSEVSDYAHEARGGKKEAEGLGWAVKFYRAQKREFGQIYVRFAEPVFLHAALTEPHDADDDDEAPLPLQKLAFEVCWRINQVTPITASALVSLVLLATQGRALTLDELHRSTGSLLTHVRRRDLPLAASAERLATIDGLRDVVASLTRNKTIEAFEEGLQPVYRVAPGQHLSAAFYRNTALHYFVDGAIGELALLHAAEHGGDHVGAFWDEAFRLRDTLKFEFFFEQREKFRKAVIAQLNARKPGWEAELEHGADPRRLLGEMQPLHAFAVLRPFVDAYWIVAQVLENQPTETAIDNDAVIKQCLALGQQQVLVGRIQSPESVAKQLFATGLQLAANHELTTPGDDLAARRRAFTADLADVMRRVDITEQLSYEHANMSIRVVGRG